MKIEGAGAIVTGGNSGIGKGVAEALLKKGSKVCIISRNKERGDQCVADFRKAYGDTAAYFLQCDLTNGEDMENCFKKSKELMGRLDIVVNNSGYFGEAHWEHLIDLNLKAVVRGCKLGLEMMRKDKGNNGGVVINNGSLSSLVPLDAMPVYGAAKHGVMGITRHMGARRDYDKVQVRFNCFCPDFVDTPLVDANIHKREDWGEYYDWIIEGLTGVVKVGPENTAAAVIDMIEDESYNGTVMFISSAHERQVIPPPVVHSPNLKTTLICEEKREK